MKIIVRFLFCIVLLVTNTIGRGVVVNSLQLESKVYNGIPANQPVHNYVASLQVNCIHICSAGWFATQFFITTGRCSYYIKDRMENYLENATVVVGSNCMSEGQSFNILFLLHHPKFIHTMPKNSTDFDIGIIMIDAIPDGWSEKIMPLHRGFYEKYYQDKSLLCGWGSRNVDEQEIIVGNNKIYSNVLNCMVVRLATTSFCTKYIEGDFENFQFCGIANNNHQKIVSADIGSPLKISIGKYDYIVGVTTDQVINGIHFIRFVRISPLYDTISYLVTKLKTLADELLSG